MIWIVNTGAHEIPCPREGCPPIAMGEEHIDTSKGHVIRRYTPPATQETSR
mgnify:CR=1 FL=1